MLGTAITFVSGYAKHVSGYVQQILGNGTTVLIGLIEEDLMVAYSQNVFERCWGSSESQRYETIITSLHEVAKTYGMGNAVKDAVIDAVYRLPPKEHLLLAAATGIALGKLTGYLYQRLKAQNHNAHANNATIIQANNAAVIQSNIADIMTDVPRLKCRQSKPA